MNGIFIPQEILSDERLNSTEKFVLAYYWYHTRKQNEHCCKKTNIEIMDDLKMSRATLFRSKQHLKELGLIRCNGGIRVWYIGYQQSQNDTIQSQNDTIQSQNDTIQSQNDTIQSQNETIQSQNDTIQSQNETHNKDKENKENKENKEIKQLSNFDVLFNELPEDKRTDEYRKFISDNYEGWMTKVNGLSKKEFSDMIGGLKDNLKSVYSVMEGKKASEERKESYQRMIEEKKSESGLFSVL